MLKVLKKRRRTKKVSMMKKIVTTATRQLSKGSVPATRTKILTLRVVL